MSTLQTKAKEFINKLKTELEKRDEALISANFNVKGELIVVITNEGMYDSYTVYEDYKGNVDFIRTFNIGGF
jgi:hypothetical protein